jgi:hypothetical protein
MLGCCSLVSSSGKTMKYLGEMTQDDCNDSQLLANSPSGDNVLWERGFCRNATGVTLVVVAVVWMLAGFLAFIFSIGCWVSAPEGARPGTNFLMFLVALFFGPFYWIFFAFSGKYCTQKPRD